MGANIHQYKPQMGIEVTDLPTMLSEDLQDTVLGNLQSKLTAATHTIPIPKLNIPVNVHSMLYGRSPPLKPSLLFSNTRLCNPTSEPTARGRHRIKSGALVPTQVQWLARVQLGNGFFSKLIQKSDVTHRPDLSLWNRAEGQVHVDVRDVMAKETLGNDLDGLLANRVARCCNPIVEDTRQSGTPMRGVIHSSQARHHYVLSCRGHGLIDSLNETLGRLVRRPPEPGRHVDPTQRTGLNL